MFGNARASELQRHYRFQFYLCFPDRLSPPGNGHSEASPEKRYTLCSESWEKVIAASNESLTLTATSCYGFAPELSWSHYRLLMRVENGQARSFYEIEAARNRWSVRQLSRQISSLLFERLAASRDREGVLRLASEGQVIDTPVDVIKDPYVLEFLDLPESSDLAETALEKALINHLQQFLLELGSGFAFVSRQGRLTLDGDHYQNKRFCTPVTGAQGHCIRVRAAATVPDQLLSGSPNLTIEAQPSGKHRLQRTLYR